MSSVRRRKKLAQHNRKIRNPTQCPPSAVKSATFKFWSLCTPRNLILVLLIVMITLFRLKIQNPHSAKSTTLISERNVLPHTSVLNRYYHRTIQTSSNTTQHYFDQAMVLSAAFNHDEAIRSLQHAILHDQSCVMCHWGIAYNYGSNINRVNDEHRLSRSVKHANLAKQYSQQVPQDVITQDLVDAMIVRFPVGRTLDDDVSTFLTAYKHAMQSLADKYPNDADILALYAESIMNTMPWHYYTSKTNSDGWMEYTPKDDTALVYDALEKAIKINPNSLLILHLYIHIYEPDLRRVIANPSVEMAADRLTSLLVPHLDEIRCYGIGHLVHMPSHIYIRIGRFENANVANIEALTIAETYYDYYNITDSHENYNQFYRLIYYCHRITFVIYSSMMNGQFRQADQYAEYLMDKCRFSTEHIAFFFENASWRDKALIRFGKFAQLIENHESDEWKSANIAKGDNIYAPTQSAYARAFAYVSLGECATGWGIYTNEFLPLYHDEGIRSVKFIWQNASGILEVARSSFLGRYYDKCKDDLDMSVEQWSKAAKQYDSLAYMEPPFWPINNRACLGQVYLDRGKYEKARQMFKDDLNQIVLNGWALKGMILTLQKLDPDGEEIKQYREQFKDAWEYADTRITAACY